MRAVLLLVATMAVVCLATDEKYTTKYDNIDVDEILRSNRLFNNYYNCLIETGKCTPEAKELKKNLPDALTTECSKCSEKQKQNSDKIIRYLIDNREEQWKVLQAKYDPQEIYVKRYRAEANKAGIKI